MKKVKGVTILLRCAAQNKPPCIQIIRFSLHPSLFKYPQRKPRNRISSISAPKENSFTISPNTVAAKLFLKRGITAHVFRKSNSNSAMRTTVPLLIPIPARTNLILVLGRDGFFNTSMKSTKIPLNAIKIKKKLSIGIPILRRRIEPTTNVAKVNLSIWNSSRFFDSTPINTEKAMYSSVT